MHRVGKMIFYNPAIDHKLSDYGIEIPIVDDRASRVFKELVDHDSTLEYFDQKRIPLLTKEDLLLAHHPDFVSRLFDDPDTLKKEIMSCYELVDAKGNYNRYRPEQAKKEINEMFKTILSQAGMTYFSTKDALVTGFSYFLGGGMHHAMSFGGRGFCLINDIVITLRKLQIENLIRTAWVIDVDAHKGDGASEITRGDSSITTMSLHMKSGWPLDQGTSDDPWFISNDVEVPIESGEEPQYLEKLKAGLLELEEKFHRPDVVIVVNGADPYIHDELPSTNKLNLSKEQMQERDLMIYTFLSERKIPQSYVMAGGYGKRSWEIYAQFLKFVWQNSSKRSEVSSR
jgi:acetoin utilization deacetylase AcuC-like enzyme